MRSGLFWTWHSPRDGLANPDQAMWVGAKLRTNYGPQRPNSAHLNGQPWTPASCCSRSTPVEARSGGQGVARSNLASPTRQCRIVTPDQSRVHPASGPSSTSLSAGELGPDWAHQREYAAPTSSAAGDPGEDNGSSPPGLDGQPHAGEGAARRRHRPSRSAPCVAGRASRAEPRPARRRVSSLRCGPRRLRRRLTAWQVRAP
jgi:hypothetical protein